jgi:NADH:ubiquinone oxidoreductase subunit
VPPEWQGWLRFTFAQPPSQQPLTTRIWERPWTPNPTGSKAAYLPSGALAAGGKRERATGDYSAWTPE